MKEQKPKVLHLITGVELGGGAEAMLLKTLPYLEKTENAVCAMTGQGEIGKKLEEEGVKVYYLDMQKKYDVRGVWHYRKVLRMYKPDLQVNYLIHADVFGRIFGKLFRIPKVISYIRSGQKRGFWHALDTATLKYTDFILTNSEVNLAYYQKTFDISNEKLTCIPNGVEIPDGRLTDDEREVLRSMLRNTSQNHIDTPNDGPVLVYVGRLVASKGHDTLLHALRKLKDEKVRFQMVLVGEGHLREELEDLTNQLDLENEVKFLGKRKDVREILQASNIFVFPSLFEGMSNALLEAMAAGLPCVVSNIPENRELVEEEKNGLTFTVRDTEDLAEKLKKLLADKNLREQLGKEARKTVEEKYDIVKIRKKLDDFFYDDAK